MWFLFRMSQMLKIICQCFIIQAADNRFNLQIRWNSRGRNPRLNIAVVDSKTKYLGGN